MRGGDDCEGGKRNYKKNKKMDLTDPFSWCESFRVKSFQDKASIIEMENFSI